MNTRKLGKYKIARNIRAFKYFEKLTGQSILKVEDYDLDTIVNLCRALVYAGEGKEPEGLVDYLETMELEALMEAVNATSFLPGDTGKGASRSDS
jgi:hypothetical protein